MFIEAHHISKAFEGQPVLSDISFTVKKGERVGIVGANGSGKTTLLKVFADIAPADEGQVSLPKQATVGYVPQAPDYDETRTVAEILAPRIAEGESHRIDKALEILGIAECRETPLTQLSSGQKTRVYLARIVVEKCDILLLDEPTNHLDVAALRWLEQYLADFHGTVCVISHDRAFLDNITNRIFELAAGSLREYGGNYSFYKEQKAIEREAYARAYEAQQKDIKRLKRSARETKADAERTDADRTNTRDNDKYAGTFFANRASKKKSAAAKAIEQRLAAIDELEKPDMDPKLKVLFAAGTSGPQIISRFSGVSYAIPTADVLSGVSFTIERGMRVALSGPNGAGKTTLIKLMLGHLEPAAGEITLGSSVKVGYVSQEHESLHTTHTVLAELTEKTGIDKTLAHRLLAWLLVSRDKMQQPVNTLSKGEQSKVLLAEVIASGANFLILDEPTNHLDIPAREAVEAALRVYTGTLLVISHDRYFLEAIGVTQHLHLHNGSLTQV